MLQPPEAKLYEHFVDRSLRELSLGLKLDNPHTGSRKRKVHDALARRGDVPRSAAEKVIEGRFLLGGDDPSYLGSGLACLWSTVGAGAGDGDGEGDLSLAPASLYAPDATNGIRRGLLKALERENQAMRKEAPKRLPMLMRMLATIVDLVPDVPAKTVDLLRSEQLPKTVAERKRVVDFLVKLKAILAEADDSLDSERTLAGRILRSQRGQVVEVTRMMRENRRLVDEAKQRGEEFRAQLADMGQNYNAMLVRAREETAKLVEKRCQEAIKVIEKRADKLSEELEAFKMEATRKQTVAEDAYNQLKTELDEATAKAEEARRVGDAAAANDASKNGEIERLQSKKKELAETIRLNRIEFDKEKAEREAKLRKAIGDLQKQKSQAREQKREAKKRLVEAVQMERKAQEREVGQLQTQKEVLERRITQLNFSARTAHENATVEAEQKLAEFQNQVVEAFEEQSARLEAAKEAEREGDRAEIEELLNAKKVAEERISAIQVALNEAEVRHAKALEEQSARLEADKKGAEERHAEALEEQRKQLEADKVTIAKLQEAERATEERMTANNAELSAQLEATKANQKENEEACLENANKAAEAAKAQKKLLEETKANHAPTLRKLEEARAQLKALREMPGSSDDGLKAAGCQLDETDAARKAVLEEELRQRQIELGETNADNAKRLNGKLSEIQEVVEELVGNLDETPESTPPPTQPVSKMYEKSNLPDAPVGFYASKTESERLGLDDSFSRVAILRGLVGQRGPTEPASASCAHDDLLPYALPPLDAFARCAVPVRLLLESSPDPTDEDVRAALRACAAVAGGGDGNGSTKRRKLNGDVHDEDTESPAAAAEALAQLRDNFALIGSAPADALPANRHGVEVPHEARWMPQGPRGESMARVAVLEHAIARCAQVAARADTGVDAARALRRAAAVLKFGQMEELYALNEAAEFEDDPHPLGTAAPLVTRPCAMVRDTLSYPIDAGVRLLSATQLLEEGERPLSGAQALKRAMDKTAAATASLRNDLRRQGRASHFYVAPPADALEFVPACATGGPALSRALESPPAEDAQEADPSAAASAAQESEREPPWLERAGQVAFNRGADDGAEDAENANPLQADSPESYATETAAMAVRAERVREERLAAARARGAVANERLRPSDYAADTWRRVINRAIVSVASLTGLEGAEGDEGDRPLDATAAFLEVHASPNDGAGAVSAQARRDGLWTEMQRHLAISQDRLWVFLRLMSGGIGGDVTEVITMANEATLKATKAIQDQRVEISKRVSDMQAKIVETVISSMLKNSKMTMDYQDENLAVVDAEAKRDLKDLASGTSGRPFFEANVALKNLSEATGEAPALKDVLAGLASVGLQMQTTLEQSLAEPSAASASLVELSHPSNSYFVSMRPDAVAAIRTAHETLNTELGALGGRRRLTLWELVEGGCQVLTRRFADLCGFMLVQARTSTGVSAMYVSHQSMYTNASQARTALAKLVSAASVYTARVPAPAFDAADPQEERGRVLTAGERVTDISITARPASLPREPLFAPLSSSGWTNIGGRWR